MYHAISALLDVRTQPTSALFPYTTLFRSVSLTRTPPICGGSFGNVRWISKIRTSWLGASPALITCCWVYFVFAVGAVNLSVCVCCASAPGAAHKASVAATAIAERIPAVLNLRIFMVL